MHVPGPPCCTRGQRVPASCVLCCTSSLLRAVRTRGAGQLAPPLTHCTHGVRVPASGVPYVPRTVCCPTGGAHLRRQLEQQRAHHAAHQVYIYEGGGGAKPPKIRCMQSAIYIAHHTAHQVSRLLLTSDSLTCLTAPHTLLSSTPTPNPNPNPDPDPDPDPNPNPNPHQ